MSIHFLKKFKKNKKTLKYLVIKIAIRYNLIMSKQMKRRNENE